MEQKLTIQALQAHIKAKDFHPDKREGYVLKLMEEIGELAEAMRKDKRMAQVGTIKGTVEEELYDVLYYIVALANLYGVDLEEAFRLKEELNRRKWGS
jgi:NTP pyrophosphatase (non-canonical NTP hydrolase)